MRRPVRLAGVSLPSVRGGAPGRVADVGWAVPQECWVAQAKCEGGGAADFAMRGGSTGPWNALVAGKVGESALRSVLGQQWALRVQEFLCGAAAGNPFVGREVCPRLYLGVLAGSARCLFAGSGRCAPATRVHEQKLCNVVDGSLIITMPGAAAEAGCRDPGASHACCFVCFQLVGHQRTGLV